MTKYCLRPSIPFQAFHPDFFDKNRPLFESVKREFLDTVVRGRPFPVDPRMIHDILQVGDRVIGAGLSINEIYQWRQDAWDGAQRRILVT
jgi:hypothetical protein